MQVEIAGARRRGIRRFVASGAIVVLLGSALVVSGSSYIGALTVHRHAQQGLAGLHLRAPIVGLAKTPTGRGFWLLASDGGVFSFGDAQFYGSTAKLPLVGPVIGMRVTPTGKGYWLFASDGGVFSFGDARFHGSEAAAHLAQPIVAMRVSVTGNGYWLTDSTGHSYAFGDALVTVATTERVAARAARGTRRELRALSRVRRVHVAHYRLGG
jgi:hypothetical protein